MPAAVITAVIVLYERAPEESEALLSLQRILDEHPEDSARLRTILYDNSPSPHAVPTTHPANVEYVHDADNGGLVAAYTHALRAAVSAQSEWLLLLDQDTTLDADYLSEMLTIIDQLRAQLNVAVIVPILEMDGRVYSPEADFFYHLRHQIPRARNYPLPRESCGVQAQPVNAYNSGAALRVRTLDAIGGFPQAFRVDYLDHALFRELQQHGFSVYVLKAVLQQKLSHGDLNQVSLARHTSVLQSQCLFVARYGKLLDRLLFRLWLLRKARHYRRLCRDPRVWKGMVRSALGPWRLAQETRP